MKTIITITKTLNMILTSHVSLQVGLRCYSINLFNSILVELKKKPKNKKKNHKKNNTTGVHSQARIKL